MSWSLWDELKNRFDFGIRSRFRWDGPGHSHPSTATLPPELGEFLNGFRWDEWMPRFFAKRRSLTVADIGAKDFFLASLLNERFSWRGEPPRVFGIELDGYRRYRNLATRAAMGKLNAAHIPRGEYHVMDFLDWDTPLDVAVLLSPFVTEEPLRRWGLPRTYFRPEELFAKLARTLQPCGLCLVSCPTEKEFSLASRYADRAGLRCLERRDWAPTSPDSERSPRFAALYARDCSEGSSDGVEKRHEEQGQGGR